MGETSRSDRTTRYVCTRCRGERSLTVTPTGPTVVLPDVCQAPASCELEMLRDYYAKPK